MASGRPDPSGRGSIAAGGAGWGSWLRGGMGTATRVGVDPEVADFTGVVALALSRADRPIRYCAAVMLIRDGVCCCPWRVETCCYDPVC
jgi:hypothetical protein